MIDTLKPPLAEAYFEHAGVKGMKWGSRKARPEGSDTYATVTITQRQKRQAMAAVGLVAVAAIMYKTGTLKPAALGGSRLALRGTKAVGKLLGKGLSVPVKALGNVGRGKSIDIPKPTVPMNKFQRAKSSINSITPKMQATKLSSKLKVDAFKKGQVERLASKPRLKRMTDAIRLQTPS